MAERPGLVQRIILKMDDRARQRAVQDARKTGQDIGDELGAGGAAGGREMAREFVRNLNAQFRADQVAVRKAYEAGTLTKEQAAEAGRLNAQAYTHALRQEMQRAQATADPAARTAQVAALGRALGTVETVSAKAGTSINRLAGPLTVLASRAAGATSAGGQLASVLGAFALGTGPMIAVLAGIAAIGTGWERVTRASREAKEEASSAAERLQAIIDRENPATGTAKDMALIDDQRRQLDNRITRLQQLMAWARAQGTGNIDRGLAMDQATLDGMIRERDRLAALVRAGGRRIDEIQAPSTTGGSSGSGGTGGRSATANRGEQRRAFALAALQARLDERDSIGRLGPGAAFGGAAISPIGAFDMEAMLASVQAGMAGVDRWSAQFIRDNPFVQMREAFSDNFATALLGSVDQGFSAFFSSGSIGDGFATLGETMLAGLGGAMVEFGKATVTASALMEAAKKALSSFLPGGGIVAGLGMIALGTALGAVGRSASRSFGNMGGGYGGAVRGGGIGSTLGADSRNQPITNIYLDAFDAKNPVQVEVMGRMVTAAESRGLVKVHPRPGTR